MQDRGRDDLIDDVQNGRMSPEAAEEEAARLGLPPLAPVPDPASYNPMVETWWTLVMAPGSHGDRLSRCASFGARTGANVGTGTTASCARDPARLFKTGDS
jgi:hypothetical protein